MPHRRHKKYQYAETNLEQAVTVRQLAEARNGDSTGDGAHSSNLTAHRTIHNDKSQSRDASRYWCRLASTGKASFIFGCLALFFRRLLPHEDEIRAWLAELEHASERKNVPAGKRIVNVYASSVTTVGWEMQSRYLLAFGRLTHDPQSVLAGVYRFALVILKLYLNVGVRIRKAGLELDIATFTDTDGWRRGFLHDPQFALLHDCSLAQLAGRA